MRVRWLLGGAGMRGRGMGREGAGCMRGPYRLEDYLSDLERGLHDQEEDELPVHGQAVGGGVPFGQPPPRVP